MAKITVIQAEFLKNLFGKANGNLKEAAKLTSETEDYEQFLTDELLEEIKKRADAQLVMNVPKATFIMQQMLEAPDSIPFLEKLHRVAADVMDRAGLSKRERPTSNTMTVGVIVLPTKHLLPEPPDVETIDQLAKPTFNALPA